MRYFGFNRPSFSMRRFGFAFSRFTPADLFANGEQGVWFDPSDLSTIFQDVGGTEPVTKDGDPVALIKDKSGNDNHAMQSTAARRPIYRTDGDLHWLEFDGVDDYLKTPPINMHYSVFAMALQDRTAYPDYARSTWVSSSGVGYIGSNGSARNVAINNVSSNIEVDTPYKIPTADKPNAFSGYIGNGALSIKSIGSEVRSVNSNMGRTGGLGGVTHWFLYSDSSTIFTKADLYGFVLVSLPDDEGIADMMLGYIGGKI